jgi:hypothetical protein
MPISCEEDGNDSFRLHGKWVPVRTCRQFLLRKTISGTYAIEIEMASARLAYPIADVTDLQIDKSDPEQFSITIKVVHPHHLMVFGKSAGKKKVEEKFQAEQECKKICRLLK